MHLFMRCMRILFGRANKTPIEGEGRTLQFASFKKFESLLSKLLPLLVFFTNKHAILQ